MFMAVGVAALQDRERQREIDSGIAAALAGGIHQAIAIGETDAICCLEENVGCTILALKIKFSGQDIVDLHPSGVTITCAAVQTNLLDIAGLEIGDTEIGIKDRPRSQIKAEEFRQDRVDARNQIPGKDLFAQPTQIRQGLLGRIEIAAELLDVRRDIRGKGGHQWVIGNARLNGVLHVVDRLLQLGQDEQHLLQSELAAIQGIAHIVQRLGSLVEGLLEGFEQLQGRIPQLFGQIQQQLGLELHIEIKATGHR